MSQINKLTAAVVVVAWLSGCVLGVKIGRDWHQNLAQAAETWTHHYSCPAATWSQGKLELTAHQKTVELGFCPDGLVLWREWTK